MNFTLIFDYIYTSIQNVILMFAFCCLCFWSWSFSYTWLIFVASVLRTTLLYATSCFSLTCLINGWSLLSQSYWCFICVVLVCLPIDIWSLLLWSKCPTIMIVLCCCGLSYLIDDWSWLLWSFSYVLSPCYMYYQCWKYLIYYKY